MVDEPTIAATATSTSSSMMPFGEIALSLSGGGYRAAGFHLGALDMLQRLDLLKDVTALSTVSGGTCTGMRYALSLKSGQTFPAFYDKLRRDLEGIDLPTLALAKLTNGTPSIPSGRWDVITAFAQVYDEKLFAGKRFGVFWEGPDIPLTELIFNSTEFRTAVAFRFRKSESAKAKIGNGNVSITPEQAKQIRIADIVAASSCFPGGFEPLSFPNDFQWPDDEAGRAVLEELRAKEWTPLPLMDGGVYDNQGMGSLMLLDDDKDNDKNLRDFGLFIFSDTDQKQASLYTLPKPHPAGFLELQHLNIFWWLLLGLSIGTLIVAIPAIAKPWHGWSGALNVLPLVLASGTALALLWLRRKIKHALRAIPQIGIGIWDFTKKLKVDQFINMIELRISSLFALASGVFLRRIRRLVYDSVYKDPRFAGRLVSNIIYDIPDAKARLASLAWLDPSDAMREVAKAANAMPTTLWFTDKAQMPVLIACGQATICYQLLDHILKLNGSDPRAIPPQLLPLFERAKELYLHLKTDPRAFVSAP